MSQLVVPFPTLVEPKDSILKALDNLMDNGISLIPVKKNGKLVGMPQLVDVFNRVAAILFDEEIPNDRGWISTLCAFVVAGAKMEVHRWCL